MLTEEFVLNLFSIVNNLKGVFIILLSFSLQVFLSLVPFWQWVSPFTRYFIKTSSIYLLHIYNKFYSIRPTLCFSFLMYFPTSQAAAGLHLFHSSVKINLQRFETCLNWVIHHREHHVSFNQARQHSCCKRSYKNFEIFEVCNSLK